MMDHELNPAHSMKIVGAGNPRHRSCDRPSKYTHKAQRARRHERSGRNGSATVSMRARRAACILVLLFLSGALLFSSPVKAWVAPFAYELANIGITFPNLNASTPESQWRKSEMPYLYQSDMTWAGVPYGAGTIETHGCGPTALDMVYVYLTGKKDKTPVDLAHFSAIKGYLEDGVTRWALMGEGAQALGLESHELSLDAGMVRNELRAGRPVICIVGPGDFTTDGHFIVLVNNAANGAVEIRDPNSPERSAKTWDLDRVLSQTRNLWSFSAA